MEHEKGSVCLDRGVLPGSSRASGAVVCSDGGHSESVREVGRQISFCSADYALRKAVLSRSGASSSDIGQKQRRVSDSTEYAKEISDSVAKRSPSEGSGTDSPGSSRVEYLDGRFYNRLGSFSVGSSDGKRSIVSRGEQLHINCLELLAIGKAVVALDLRQVSVLFATDNVFTASAIRRQGSKSATIQKVAHLVFKIIWDRNIVVRVSKIPGILNVVADSLSRDHSIPTEWELPRREFQRLVTSRGYVQIDLFATLLNRKVPTFVSVFSHPEAMAVDAFAVDWNRWDQIYLFPPHKLLPAVVKRLRSFRFGELIVVPRRPNAVWFPYLMSRAAELGLEEGPEQEVLRKVVKAQSICCDI